MPPLRSDATNVPRWIVGSLTGSGSVNWNSGAIYNYGRTFASIPIVTWSRHGNGVVVNGTGIAIEEGQNLGFTNTAFAIVIERSRLIFNSTSSSTLYFKIWDFEA